VTGRPGPSSADHYSYTTYADRDLADRFDALRFGGPIGGLLAETQDRVLAEFLGPLEGRRVVDVGTGTGRAAISLARRGAVVTGIDASAEMLAVAVERASRAGVTATFARGDAHALDFADRAFDAAVSLRVLMHTPDWRLCLAELCRVSRGRVVFDYPARVSVAAIQAGTRRVAARLGVRTETYRVISERAVRNALAGAGFAVVGAHRQFVLPIALHKTFDSRALTVRVEGLLAAAGLLRVFGSPVTVVAERCAS
jgi:ubiquinone/menaquinone biosynthesis C-methylase UbiE